MHFHNLGLNIYIIHSEDTLICELFEYFTMTLATKIYWIDQLWE